MDKFDDNDLYDKDNSMITCDDYFSKYDESIAKALYLALKNNDIGSYKIPEEKLLERCANYKSYDNLLSSFIVNSSSLNSISIYYDPEIYGFDIYETTGKRDSNSRTDIILKADGSIVGTVARYDDNKEPYLVARVDSLDNIETRKLKSEEKKLVKDMIVCNAIFSSTLTKMNKKEKN
jgi:hypothetical protein